MSDTVKARTLCVPRSRPIHMFPFASKCQGGCPIHVPATTIPSRAGEVQYTPAPPLARRHSSSNAPLRAEAGHVGSETLFGEECEPAHHMTGIALVRVERSVKSIT